MYAHFPSFTGNIILGMNTLLPILEPVIICAPMTVSASCVTKSLVPLHKPGDGFKFRNNIIGVPIFKESLCEGTPLNSS
jgi:hypothetical protein